MSVLGATRPLADAWRSGASTGTSTGIARLSAPPQGDRPVTLGIGEPFTTTVTISLCSR